LPGFPVAFGGLPSDFEREIGPPVT